MKTLLVLSLLATGFTAVAQRSLFSKEVTTDGQQLRIRVDVEQSGRSLHYSRSFDVSALDAKAVRALENEVLDSLDQALSAQYAGLFGNRKREDKTQKKCQDIERTAMTQGQDRGQIMEAKAEKSLSTSDIAPSSVLHREDKENGRLWMQYTFQKDGDELVFERTANVIGKTEREKQAIIRETERSLGIKTVNQ